MTINNNSSIVLHQRAELLAKNFTQEENIDDVEIIEFIINNEHYGIESLHVKNVLPAKNITKLPNTPAFLVGIVNIHGVITSIINLKVIFDLPNTPINDNHKIIILNSEVIKIGILADEIIKIDNINVKNLQSSLPVLTGIRTEFLLGITQDQKIILNADKLINHEMLIVNDYV
jgi:purine-binding chemotaxis protein CheW